MNFVLERLLTGDLLPSVRSCMRAELSSLPCIQEQCGMAERAASMSVLYSSLLALVGSLLFCRLLMAACYVALVDLYVFLEDLKCSS